MTGWDGFFQAQVGAAASLAGLVLVGVSINFTRVIGSPHLPNRALEALVMLLVALVAASLALWPYQTSRMLGAEVLPITASAWALVIGLHLHNLRMMERSVRARAAWGLGLGQLTAAGFTVGAVLLVADAPGGAQLLAAACLLSYALALLNAWVLLVEINR